MENFEFGPDSRNSSCYNGCPDLTKDLKMTLDARAVNAGMVVEPCSPPHIKEMLHALEAKSYYARLDLLSAYWQFPLAPGVQHLSTFRVGHQHIGIE
jgi:hypothetical protein